jgi:predicted nucleic acid-binding protein
MPVPEAVVFDAEPLVAHADDEAGADVVEGWLDAVAVDDSDGYVSYVNLSEVRYVLARKYDTETAGEYTGWLVDVGVVPVDVESLWTTASDYVLRHSPALGDSFALATADEKDAELLVGADDDYDDVTEVEVTRFREEPA